MNSRRLWIIVSWRPDSEVMATNAFTLDWTQFQGYANPPWNLIGRVLSCVRNQKAQVTLAAPIWRSQIWYPTLQEMAVQMRTPHAPKYSNPDHADLQSQQARHTVAVIEKFPFRFRWTLLPFVLHFRYNSVTLPWRLRCWWVASRFALVLHCVCVLSAFCN